MRSKKLGIFIAFLAIFLFILISVNALKFDCAVKPLAQCTSPWNVVFKLSGTTNAHAEIFSLNNYTSAFCCNWTGTRTCTTTVPENNTIVKLSSTGNAHGSVKRGAYTTNICYQDIECENMANCDGNYPIQAFSLSATTNAHFGDFASYSPTKICCKNPNEPSGRCVIDLGGTVCNANQYCSGTPLVASDTPNCCNGCCANLDSITCNGWVCGTRVNNCGQTVDCSGGLPNPWERSCTYNYGTCGVQGTESCSGGGWTGTCLPIEPDPGIMYCQTNGRVCGDNTCGGVCGTCGPPNTCNTGTGQCVCTVNETQTQTCTRVFGSGYQCGTTINNCNGAVNCGSCNATSSCIAGTCVNGATCSPGSCSGRECGIITNGTCSGSLNCGSCNATASCDNPSGICIQGVQPCTLTSASWSSSKVTRGTSVTLTLNGNNCNNGENVRFDIAEVDCLSNCKYSDKDAIDTLALSVNSVTGTFSNGHATATWVAEWVNDTGLFTGADPEYAFNATVTSLGIGLDDSGVLSVNKTDNIQPVARIVGPKDRQIYFKPNLLSFEHASTGTIDKIEWEFGGDVSIQGQSGTFTNYNLTGANIYDKINATYLTSGQKVVKLTASNIGGGIGRDQISILVIESPFVMAYISSPRPYEIVTTNNGEVFVDSDGPLGSYVVEGAGDITNASDYTVTCLAGSCPNRTEGEIQGTKLNIINWNTAPPLNTSSNLEFTWGFSGTTQTKNGRGTELEIVSFQKIFSYAGDNWVDLNIKYYEGTTKRAESGSRNEFVMTKSQTSCSEDGEWWIAPDNTRTSSLNDCKKGSSVCCPTGKVCDGSNNCVSSAAFLCSHLLNSGDCNNAPDWIAANSVREKYINPNLSIGDIIDTNIGGDPSCYSTLNAWWCEWESGACVAKENLSYSSCGSSGTPPSSGVCVFTENTNDNCDDGILTYSWTAIWQGNVSLPHPDCVDGGNSIECPAQIRLPFFNAYNFVIAILAIFAVYFLISRRHKKVL